MDESRKLYEEWFKSRYGSLSIPPKQRLVMRTYSWAAWQASRAAIEVKLPDFYDYTDQDTTRASAEKSAYNSGLYDSQEAIRAAGIKVKE